MFADKLGVVLHLAEGQVTTKSDWATKNKWISVYPKGVGKFIVVLLLIVAVCNLSLVNVNTLSVIVCSTILSDCNPLYKYLTDLIGIPLLIWIEQLSNDSKTKSGASSISGTNTGSFSWYTTVIGFSDKYCLTPAESKLDNLDLWILSLSSLPDEWLYIVNNSLIDSSKLLGLVGKLLHNTGVL